MGHKKVWVLLCNDDPVGVYLSEKVAERERKIHQIEGDKHGGYYYTLYEVEYDDSI